MAKEVIGGGNRTNKYFWALRGIKLEIQKGETVGIIGTNGAGKTTLLRVIAGIYTPDEGAISVDGTTLILSIGLGFKMNLTGMQNIYLNGVILGLQKSEIDRHLAEIVDFSELKEFLHAPLRTYSQGMLARLGFSIAVNVNADILLIDEIIAVGDMGFEEKCRKKVEEYRAKGKTIVLVSNNMGDIRKFCRRVIWLEKGRIRHIGGCEEVIQQYRDFVVKRDTEICNVC